MCSFDFACTPRCIVKPPCVCYADRNVSVAPPPLLPLTWTCACLSMQSLQNCQVQTHPISEDKPQLISHILAVSMGMLVRMPGIWR